MRILIFCIFITFPVFFISPEILFAQKDENLINEAHALLRLWEAEDPEVRSLWLTMNDWVYDGFEQTYRRLGISFDKTYYESETYKLGKAYALTQRPVQDSNAQSARLRKEGYVPFVWHARGEDCIEAGRGVDQP